MTGDGLPAAVEIRRAELVMLSRPTLTLWRILLRRPVDYHFDAADRDEARGLQAELQIASERFWKTRDVDELEQLAERLKLLDAKLAKLSSGVWVDGHLVAGKAP